jgi:hypothetical protein
MPAPFFTRERLMARRSFEEKNIRNLTKIAGGRSYGITLPLEYVKKLDWEPRQKLEVILKKDHIIIRELK